MRDRNSLKKLALNQMNSRNLWLKILSLTFFINNEVFALSPVNKFIPQQNIGSITQYKDASSDIHLSNIPSKIGYDDLKKEHILDLKKSLETKKDFGKLFGFKDWTAKNQNLIEEKNQRIFIIEGHYKNSKNINVNFLEIYWADKQKSGQYLITSESKELKVENYKEYLK